MIAGLLMTVARIAVPLVIMMFYLANAAATKQSLAIYALATAFYLCSSILVLMWSQLKRSVIDVLLWSEIVVAAFLIINRIPQSDVWIMQTLLVPILATAIKHHSPALWGSVAVWFITSIWTVLQSSLDTSALNAVTNGCLGLFVGACASSIRTANDAKRQSEAHITQLQRSQEALSRIHRQLLETADKERDMAALEERHRLAREIHDGVAHKLTTLIVQLQVVERLFRRNAGDTEQTVSMIHQCQESSREALLEVRLAVRALRNASLAGLNELEALERLAREFTKVTGVEVLISSDDSARRLAPDVLRVECCYRIFQEALTNAIRHGQAKRIVGVLEAAGDEFRLTITNDGIAPSEITPGVGLQSMMERVETLGGSLSLQVLKHGFRVEVSFPLANNPSLQSRQETYSQEVVL